MIYTERASVWAKATGNEGKSKSSMMASDMDEPYGAILQLEGDI
jgi:hypothetical protein